MAPSVRHPLPVLAAFVLLALAACGGGRDRPEWRPAGEAPLENAQDECQVLVDDQMRLRGYPRRPSPETPQALYRREIFDACMRGKGYEQK